MIFKIVYVCVYVHFSKAYGFVAPQEANVGRLPTRAPCTVWGKQTGSGGH